MADTTTYTLVIPTAINIVGLVQTSILTARRQGFTGIVELPSLRQRARMIVKEVGILPVRNADLPSSYEFAR